MGCNAHEILQALNGSLQESPVYGTGALNKVCDTLAEALSVNLLVCMKDSRSVAHSGVWFAANEEKLEKLTCAKLHMVEGAKALTTLKALKLLPESTDDMSAYVVPLKAEHTRIGSVLLFKADALTEDDFICAEWLGTVAGLMARFSLSVASTDAERQKKVVRTALGALSYSELEAVTSIFAALPNLEGLVVASKVADQVGITRSVIVNALRKLESAVVIETRSLGMKGTYIRVTNAYLIEELDRLRA